MEIEFRDESLRRLFEDAGYHGGYARPLVRAFRKRVTSIRAAADERDIRLVKGNHFEKLTGRSGEYSVRLKVKWRLTLAFDSRGGVKTVVILGIENYH